MLDKSENVISTTIKPPDNYLFLTEVSLYVNSPPPPVPFLPNLRYADKMGNSASMIFLRILNHMKFSISNELYKFQCIGY